MRELSPAEQRLKHLGIRDPKDIDLEAIAFDAGALVKYRQLDGCEARIVGRGDKAVITIQKNSIRTRQRFSLGHELGHWHHHRGRSFICRPEDIGNRSFHNPSDPERVADAYAADLLLPRFLFETMANDAKRCNFDTVEALRKEFQTSITATAIRLVEFGPEPAMLVCHSTDGRKWFNRPKNIPEHWFPNNELDSDSYAFEVLYGSMDKSRRHVMPADAWFGHWSAKKYEVYEESREIHNGEVLSIIVFKDGEMLED